ncbi:hypothetical protein A2U01_0114245, partial [Trifolium medium]|nr:hypothetical protein [Trifolium medium]
SSLIKYSKCHHEIGTGRTDSHNTRTMLMSQLT